MCVQALIEIPETVTAELNALRSQREQLSALANNLLIGLQEASGEGWSGVKVRLQPLMHEIQALQQYLPASENLLESGVGSGMDTWLLSKVIATPAPHTHHNSKIGATPAPNGTVSRAQVATQPRAAAPTSAVKQAPTTEAGVPAGTARRPSTVAEGVEVYEEGKEERVSRTLDLISESPLAPDATHQATTPD
jgi:hypothetical protein